MKYFQILFSIILLYNFFINALEINNNKNLNNILNYIDNYNNNVLKIWVFFNSKNIIKIDNIDSVSSPFSSSSSFIDQITGEELTSNDVLKITGITNESIERRRIKSNLDKEDIIDSADLPISEQYINEIINCGKINKNNQTNIENYNDNIISINQKSNWLNSISININNNNINKENLKLILTCISNKSYVNHIDLIKKLIKRPILKNNFNKITKQDDNSQQSDEDETILPDNDPFYGESIKQIKQIKIDELHKLGLHGENINILVIDDDFYLNHPSLESLIVIGQKEFFNSNNQSSKFEEQRKKGLKENGENFHGTSVLSVIGGYDEGKLIGPAYKSKYLLAKIKVSEEEDSIFEEDQFIAAIEWGEQMGAQIISSSLSFCLTLNYSYFRLDGKQSYTTKAANIAIEKGIVVVNAMGNDDFGLFGGPNDGEYVIAVGAVDEYGGTASFSSLGPTADGRLKPDTLSMGLNVKVADITSPTKYQQYSGTSFSCPLIAGAIALILQAHPTWTPKQVHQAVIGGSVWANQPHYLLGYGLFNSIKSLNFKPIKSSCNSTNNGGTIGCSNGNGICCNNKCICAPAYYGEYCQYKRIECSYRCKYDFIKSSKCQINNQGNSYLCISKDENDPSIIQQNQNPFIPPIKSCDDINFINSNYSLFEEFKITKPPLAIFSNFNNNENNNSAINLNNIEILYKNLFLTFKIIIFIILLII